MRKLKTALSSVPFLLVTFVVSISAFTITTFDILKVNSIRYVAGDGVHYVSVASNSALVANKTHTLASVTGTTGVESSAITAGHLVASGTTTGELVDGGAVTATCPGTALTTEMLYDNAGVCDGVAGFTSDGTNVTAAAGILRATSPRVTTDIWDANGLPIITFTATATAVDNFKIANAAAGGFPVLSAIGTDTDINVGLTPKGLGTIQVNKNATAAPAIVTGTIVQYVGTDTTNPTILVDAFAGASLINLRRADTTNAAPSALQAGESIGMIAGLGYSTAYQASKVQIAFNTFNTWSGSDTSTAIVFATTPTGSTTRGNKMELTDSGHLNLGAGQLIGIGSITGPDVALERYQAGTFAINAGESATVAQLCNGTAANCRDLTARHVLGNGVAPTVSSGFGSGATIAGRDEAMRVTLGTAPGTGGIVAFGTTFANAPACSAADETTLTVLLTTTTTVSTVTITSVTGVLVAADKIAIQCKGYL